MAAAPEEPAAPVGGQASEIGGGEAPITFTRSERSSPVATRRMLLEASDLLWVAISYDCRAGVCRQCKTKSMAPNSGQVINLLRSL